MTVTEHVREPSAPAARSLHTLQRRVAALTRPQVWMATACECNAEIGSTLSQGVALGGAPVDQNNLVPRLA